MLRLSLSLLLLLLLFFLWRPLPSVAVGESSQFLPAPQNLTIQSYNFKNVLRWSPVKGINGTVSYRVEHRLQSAEVWEKVNCTNITKPECDFDHGKDFYRNILRVRAEQGRLKSTWSQTAPFQAKKDTILGPPRAINVTAEANSLIVRFLPPVEHEGDSFGFKYLIYIGEGSVSPEDLKKPIETSNKEKIFKNLKEGQVYCFQVEAVYQENKGQKSDSHCKKTTITETRRIIDVILYFVVILFFIFAIFLSLWVLRKYKSTIKSFWKPPLRIPSHYEEDLENPHMVMEYTFQNCAEEHWDTVSVISSTGQSQTMRDSFASENQVDASRLKEQR